MIERMDKCRAQESSSHFGAASGSVEEVRSRDVVAVGDDTQAGNAPVGVSGRFYRPELDVLRFSAFLMVYAGHTLDLNSNSPSVLKALKGLPGLGLPLFFALSAYLLTELLMIEKRATGSIRVRYFYARRILRIWPLYFVILGFGFCLSLVHGPAIPKAALLSYLLLVGNWYTGCNGYLSSGLSPLWSISVEEQFYLLWPLAVRFASTRTMDILWRLGWILSQISVIFLCSKGALVNPTIWTNSLVQLQYFALGAGLSLYLKGSVPKMRRGVRLVIVASAMMLFVCNERIFNTHAEKGSVDHTYPHYLLLGLSVLMLLIATLGSSSLQRWQSLRFLGKISYGLYVYHAILFTFVTNVAHSFGWYSALIISLLGFGVTGGVAWISYDYLERPFIRIKERYTIVKSRAA